MKKICILILSTLLLASTASARPIKFIQKLRPPNYRLYLDNAISDSQVVWKLEVAPTPDIVKNYTAWVKWKDYRVAQFEKMAPKERATTYYVINGLIAGDDSDDGLTPETAWKTRGKALSEINASGGNVRVRFARGYTWTDDSNFAITVDNVTIDDYDAGGTL